MLDDAGRCSLRSVVARLAYACNKKRCLNVVFRVTEAGIVCSAIFYRRKPDQRSDFYSQVGNYNTIDIIATIDIATTDIIATTARIDIIDIATVLQS